MTVFDILFYVSWVYLSTLIAVELLLFDISIRLITNEKRKEAKVNKAVSYYVNRKNIWWYRITPIFCLLQIVGIIANLVRHYSDSWISAILIIVLAIMLIIIQTKKNITVVEALKKNEDTNLTDKKTKLTFIYSAHIITLLILVTIIFCYVFKF